MGGLGWVRVKMGGGMVCGVGVKGRVWKERRGGDGELRVKILIPLIRPGIRQLLSRVQNREP